MTKFLYATAAAAALTLASTPALAVPAAQNATATARIVRPLTLTSFDNLDLGTITIVNNAAATVGISKDGVFACASANVVCSGVPKRAMYKVTGVNNQSVTVTADDVIMDNQSNTLIKLTLDVDAPASVLIDNSSPTNGTDFGIGGSVSVSGATVEGTYVGNFLVTVNY